MPERRLIVFDLDGTLIDSKRDLANAVNALLVECGAEALPEEDVGRMVGDGAATLVARAFEARRLARPADALARFLAIYDAHLTDHTRPYEGIPAALAALAPRATLAVLTNKPLGATQTILRRLELSPFFDPQLVVGGDGPLPRKPDPAGLEMIMRRGAADPAETVLVGDSPIDFRTARAAGTAICVARYGFGYAGFSVDDATRADVIVDAPGQLAGL